LPKLVPSGAARQKAMKAAALLTVCVAGYAFWRGRQAPVRSSTARQAEPVLTATDDRTDALPETTESAPPRAIVQVAAASPVVVAKKKDGDQQVMAALREAGDSSPLFSLELARDAIRRFPNSPNAAERAWYICKSLVNLGRFREARDEARSMVATYAGTAWALDVERHLLVNPLDLPGDPPR
jgi:hypothetical protein